MLHGLNDIQCLDLRTSSRPLNAASIINSFLKFAGHFKGCVHVYAEKTTIEIFKSCARVFRRRADHDLRFASERVNKLMCSWLLEDFTYRLLIIYDRRMH